MNLLTSILKVAMQIGKIKKGTVQKLNDLLNPKSKKIKEVTHNLDIKLHQSYMKL